MDFEGLGGVAMVANQAYDSPKMAMARQPNLKERLAMAVAQAEERLVAAKRAKELFERNPDLEELLNIMQRGHF